MSSAAPLDPVARRLNLAYADAFKTPTFTDFPFRRRGGNIVIADREAERLSGLLEKIIHAPAPQPLQQDPGQLQFDLDA